MAAPSRPNVASHRRSPVTAMEADPEDLLCRRTQGAIGYCDGREPSRSVEKFRAHAAVTSSLRELLGLAPTPDGTKSPRRSSAEKSSAADRAI